MVEGVRVRAALANSEELKFGPFFCSLGLGKLGKKLILFLFPEEWSSENILDPGCDPWPLLTKGVLANVFFSLQLA